MNFDPNKLQTTFLEPMTPYGPIEGRKYTLTHSDYTAMLFLTIAKEYDYSAINQRLRDEVLGTWDIYDNSYRLFLYAYIGDDLNYYASKAKYNTFKRHMNMAIQAILYGDRELLKKYPDLTKAPIYLKFSSSIPAFNNFEFYGYVKDYIIINN